MNNRMCISHRFCNCHTDNIYAFSHQYTFCMPLGISLAREGVLQIKRMLSLHRLSLALSILSNGFAITQQFREDVRVKKSGRCERNICQDTSGESPGICI